MCLAYMRSWVPSPVLLLKINKPDYLSLPLPLKKKKDGIWRRKVMKLFLKKNKKRKKEKKPANRRRGRSTPDGLGEPLGELT